MIDNADLLAAMAQRDLAPPSRDPLIADGQWHRCRAVNKPAGKDDGSYMIKVDGPVPFALFRNWTDGQGVSSWRGDRNRALTEDEQKAVDEWQAKARAEDAKRAAEKAAAAKKEARRIWAKAKPATAHAYLNAKRVKAHGIRFSRDHGLVVPMYNPDAALVNLQLIKKDGSKYFLHGGQAKGCFFPIPAKPDSKSDFIVVVEGYATGATIHEVLGCDVAVAFNAGNLVDVATMLRRQLGNQDAAIWKAHEETAAEQGLKHARRRSFPCFKIVIAADDDWKTEDNPGLMSAMSAARAARATVAVPKFGKDRGAKQTDFNDMRDLGAILEAFANTVEPTALLGSLLKNPHAAHGAAMVKQLAELQQDDRPGYEKLKASLKTDRRALAKAVSEEVQAMQRRSQVATPAAAVVDIKQLAAQAKEIIASEDVLTMFYQDARKVIAGEETNAKLVYLAGTSRLLPKPMHIAMKGPSAAGKSGVLDRVYAFFPEEAYVSFTTLSEKALLYSDDFKHKILRMSEAAAVKEQELQDLLLRELMSAGKLRYAVATKDKHNNIVTQVIEKEGPVQFAVTTTKTALHQENETRILSLEVDDSRAQTKAIMRMIAANEGRNREAHGINFQAWHAFQRWLAAGTCAVDIPYAEDLIDMIDEKRLDIRMRRDSSHVLTAIKASTLIHRAHRKCNKGGEIVATINGDYKLVYGLLADLLAKKKASKKVLQTVAAVADVEQQRGLDENDKDKGASVREVAKKIDKDDSATRRRLYAAVDAGYVVNLAQRGRPAQYRTTGQKPQQAGSASLPTPNALIKHRRDRKNKGGVPAKRLHADKLTH